MTCSVFHGYYMTPNSPTGGLGYTEHSVAPLQSACAAQGGVCTPESITNCIRFGPSITANGISRCENRYPHVAQAVLTREHSFNGGIERSETCEYGG